MSDYLDVIAFIEGSNGKKFPRKIGRIKLDPSGKKGNVYLDVIPMRWDGSAAIEEPRDRDFGNGARSNAPNTRPPF